MRLKTRIILATVPIVAVTTAGAVIATQVYLRRKHRREATSFLSDEVRDALQGLCGLKGEDFVPDGLGTSLYQRRLDTLTDRQLIGVYLLIKVGEVLRARGTDLHHLSREDLLREVSLLHGTKHHKHDRHELLKQIGGLGVDTAKAVLEDGLLLASIALHSE